MCETYHKATHGPLNLDRQFHITTIPFTTISLDFTTYIASIKDRSQYRDMQCSGQNQFPSRFLLKTKKAIFRAAKYQESINKLQSPKGRANPP